MKRLCFIKFIAIIAILITAACSVDKSGPYDENYSEAEDKSAIDAYLQKIIDDGKYKIDTTELGVFYYIKQQGSGDYPRSGDTLSVEFSAYTLSGKFIGSSKGYQNDIYRFIYKEIDHIRGWDEMMGYLQKGTEAEFIVPPNLAFGSEGYTADATTAYNIINVSSIPSYTSLVFLVNMKDISSPYIQ